MSKYETQPIPIYKDNLIHNLSLILIKINKEKSTFLMCATMCADK